MLVNFIVFQTNIPFIQIQAIALSSIDSLSMTGVGFQMSE